MKILVVGSLNSHAGKFAPFIVEQAEALTAAGCEIEYFGINGKGIAGYLKQLPKLRKVIRKKQIDIVHAHFGLSCLLCCLQRIVPVVSTYHGSDINNPKIRKFSKVAMTLSAWNVFVSQRTLDIVAPKKKYSLIPCGVNLPKEQAFLPDMSHVLKPGKKHVLFAGAFDNKVKDSALAKEVCALLPDVQLIELKGYNRDEVNALMYACDTFLMTSKTEGSPQVVKEAMVCGCPIVSTDVGDVVERTEGLEGCYVAKTREPDELAELLEKALAFGKRTDGLAFVVKAGLVNDLVAKKLIEIYKYILN